MTRMDCEEDILSPGVDLARSEAYNNRLVVEGFVEGYPGRVFTVSELVSELPFYVNPKTCTYILKKCRFAEPIRVNDKTVKYRSKAPTLMPVNEEEENTDCLGKQARADYYDLVNSRALCIKKRFKVITKF